MKASTEEFLWILLWTASQLARPTYRNLTDDFEAWAWRNGFGPEIARLEARKLLERENHESSADLVRLTNIGRLTALGGRDPDAKWARRWDGHWRMVVFDFPVCQNASRKRLWRSLRCEGFGFLQNSVWITPDPIDASQLAVTSRVPSVEWIIVLEARPVGVESDAVMVNGAWDFEFINGEYRRYLDAIAGFPVCGLSGDESRIWAEKERAAWKQAIRYDPFLPNALLPRTYLGREAWRERQVICQRLINEMAPPA
ncbi:MAG TPA: hypothetical protein VHE61_13480 [Opitutaceae bacterium]|nr:hypothetical protein [Opitutaceae bacterium]